MDRSKVEDFVANAALLAAHLTKQCDTSIAELQQSADAMKRTVADGQAELSQQSRSAVREALSAEIPAAVGALDDAADRFRRIADQLQQQQSALERRAAFLGWKSLAALVVGAVAVVGATAYAASWNLERAQQAQVRAEVLEALEQVAITSCDGRPCIKLEEGLQRWAKNDEYVLVDGGAAAP